jgi:UDP-glucose 4-epimerase
LKLSKSTQRIAFVTGAYGFIGRYVSMHLATKKFEVCGVGHGVWPPSEAERWGVKDWLNGEIHSSNLELLRHQRGAPDIVFHLAGGSSVGAAVQNPREDFNRTVVSTLELIDWIRRNAPSAKLVAVSSAAVYGAGHSGPIREGTDLQPYSPYGRHKRMMEEMATAYAADYGMKVVIARLFSVYGPGLRKQLLWDLCAKMDKTPSKIILGGSGQELRDWTHVSDVARALGMMANVASSSAPVINIGTGVGTSVREIAEKMISVWFNGDVAPKLDFNAQARPGDPFSLIADNTSLSTLGFEWNHRLMDGLSDYVHWYRQNGRES